MNELEKDSRITKVSITVVAFSDYETVKTCLQSLLDQEYDESVYDVDYRVFVNNRDSIDPDKLHEQFPEFEIITPSRNRGYAGAIHQAWKDATNGIIVVTNDDLKFRSEWLNTLLEPLRDDKVFASTSSIINDGESEEELNGTLNPIGIRIPDVFVNRTRILFPSGASFAFKKDDVEPLYPEYFLYFEDVFLGLKARLRGFDIRMNPVSKVDHRHRLSTSKMSSYKLHYYQEKNRLANIFLIYQGTTILKLTPYLIADLVIRLLQIITIRRHPLGMLRAWLYYITHVGTTLFKRFKTGKSRKVADREILPFMSGKLLPGNNIFARALNSVFLSYSRLVGLNFYEIAKKHEKR